MESFFVSVTNWSSTDIHLEICWKRSLADSIYFDDRAVIDEIYEGSHFASFLPFNLCVVRGRSTILRNYGYSSNRYFYPCLLFECFIYNLPATVTIETSPSTTRELQST